jgi:hypothetical protein
LALKASNDYTSHVTIKITDGDCYHVVNDSKFTPFNVIYHLGKEFEYFALPPGAKDVAEPVKAIQILHGDAHVTVHKTSRFTFVTERTTVSESIMVCESSLCGVSATVVYARC